MSQFKPGSESSVVPARRSPSTSIVVPPVPLIDPSRVEESGKEAEEEAGGSKLALICTLLFVFLRFSFLHEFVMSKVGFDSHLLLIVGLASVLSTLFTGALFSGFSHRISLAWLGFAAWMCLATAGSIWKGGSFAVLFPYLRTTLLLVLLIPAVAINRKNISSVLKVIGVAGLVPILLGFLSNDYRTGRLELAGAGASIENSNDFAAILILVLPAIAYLTLRRNTNVVLKIAGLIAMGMACYLILGTGSRGALVSMIFATLYVLKAGSGKVRLAILVGVPLLALVSIPFLPGEASHRLASIFNSSDQTEESAASQEQRTALLMASLRISMQHPLLGVGPSTFSIYQAQDAQSQGQRGMWHETHNSYTQVSSECGIPALGFFVAAIWMTFAVFRRGIKSPDPDIRGLSQILALMVVSYSVCMFFLSQAYGFGFPVLGGLAIAVDRLLKRSPAAIST